MSNYVSLNFLLERFEINKDVSKNQFQFFKQLEGKNLGPFGMVVVFKCVCSLFDYNRRQLAADLREMLFKN